jgi:hypothetical protein
LRRSVVAPTPAAGTAIAKDGGMAKIVAATFDTSVKADAAVLALLADGIPRDRVTAFANNAPGQHAQYPVGGDEDADPGARGAEKRAMAGAAVGLGIGATVGAIAAGPIGAAGGGGLGALTGAIAGTMSGLGNDEEVGTPPPLERRPAGTIVAVQLDESVNDQRVIERFRDREAMVIETAEGEWRDGGWADFDPVARPRVLHVDHVALHTQVTPKPH